MKIGHLENQPSVASTAHERGTERKAAGAAQSPANEASAKVDLSTAATTLGSGSASFDAAKVDRIAQAIRDGKFEINAEAIADKLIGNARELLGSNHG